MTKATNVKNLRISSAFNQTELALKAKQIAELAQKNMKVRITMQVSENVK